MLKFLHYYVYSYFLLGFLSIIFLVSTFVTHFLLSHIIPLPFTLSEQGTVALQIFVA